MEIERIEEFLVLAETCKYETASEILFTTNSTLSKHIASMERELGCKLFNRTSRKVSLSTAGECFYESGKQIVDLYHQTQIRLDHLNTEGEKTLTIAFPDIILQYGVLGKIAEFSSQHPDIDVKMMEQDGQNMANTLRMKNCDFGFAARMDLIGKDIERRPYYTDHLVLLVPQDHPLADLESVPITALKNECFALHSKSFYENNEFCSLCQEAGFQPNIILSSANTTNLVDLVRHHKAISVFSEMRCMTFSDIDTLSIVDLDPTISFTLHLLFLKGRRFTLAMHKFYEYIMKQARP